MMKKIAILVIVLGIVFLQGFSVVQAAPSKDLAAARALAMAKKEELNNTQWTIAVAPVPGKGQAETDVISFVNNRVVSRNLNNAGFDATGFSVRVKEDETVIWETIQKDEKDNAALWRGEIKDGVMWGVLRKRDSRGRLSDFSFASQ